MRVTTTTLGRTRLSGNELIRHLEKGMVGTLVVEPPAGFDPDVSPG